jgi:hypothetical protein
MDCSKSSATAAACKGMLPKHSNDSWTYDHSQPYHTVPTNMSPQRGTILRALALRHIVRMETRDIP